MNDLSLNCLPEGESLRDLVWRNCAIGFDLRFCRSVAVTPDAAQRHKAEQVALTEPDRIA
ncbi:hypothetical protein [Roseisalinus antarcticus]|uniref:hypothetical protein n=1 Tax=Roseisalinus antarcticus TaxID=254357 RepID=UPI000A270E5B|nr:hypothetical protein [Roseisalinus antarcticus]